MKISEVGLLDIKQGLRFKSVDGETFGTVIAVDFINDFSVYYIWDNEIEVNSWFGNDCDCEIIEENQKINYDTKKIKKEYLQRQDDLNNHLIKYVSKKITDKKSNLFGLKLPNEKNEQIQLILENMF